MIEQQDSRLPLITEMEAAMPARKCPYCKVVSNFSRSADRIINAESTPPGTNNEEVSLDICQNCNAVVYFRTIRGGGDVKDMYPGLTESAPDELPSNVRKAFDEALICYAAKAPNGALLMCRRAIQEALNDLGAKNGDLPTQLSDLVSKYKLTPDLKEWADHARIGGKLAGHGTGGNEWGDATKIWGDVTDAEAVIAFCEGFFEYVYVLPERNKQRRVKTGTPPVAQSGTGSNAP